MRSYATEGTLVSQLNLAVIAAAGHRRQAIGVERGARGLSSIAVAPVALGRIKDGAGDLLTTPGLRTAFRSAPPAISRLGRNDPRRMALALYATAREQVGAVKGAAWDSQPSASGASDPDAAILSRIRSVRVIDAAEGIANQWLWSRSARKYIKGSNRVVLSTKKGPGKPITATHLLYAVTVEGLGMADILRRSGWSVHSKHQKRLSDVFLEIADALSSALLTKSRSVV